MNLRNRNNNRRKVAFSSEGTWAVSYVDMLTLLLCFFILFFHADRINFKTSKSGTIQKISTELNSALGTATSIQSFTPTDTVGKVFKSIKLDHDMLTQTEVKNQTLEIQFEKVSFFDSGSTHLSKDGERVVARMISILKPYKDLFRITVQGYTDTQSFSNNKKLISDNWELSVIRATSVLKKFKSEGFPQENLSAEGFADTRVDRKVASDDWQDLAEQRKITLKIEEIKP